MKSFENPASFSQKEQISVSETSVETEVSLRTKEHLGTLTPEEFATLIDHDFNDVLKDITPIPDEFDPEIEVQQILTHPSEERQNALDTFKDKLTRQRKAIAECRCFVERQIAFDTDVTKEQLMDILARFAVQYGFSEKQFTDFEEVFDIYSKYHARVHNMRTAFPDDRDLVKHITGMDLAQNADCRVEVGSVSLDIYTDGMSAAAIYHRNTEVVEHFRHGGFAVRVGKENPFLFNVINMDPIVRKVQADDGGTKTLVHEQEHQKNYLLSTIFNFSKKSLFKDYIEEYMGVPDPVLKREILEIAFVGEMENAYERAKDEILAILSSQTTDYLRTGVQSLFFKGEIRAYDYLKEQREITNLDGDVLYTRVAKELLIDEYKVVLTQGIMAITTLVDVGGYTNAEATALLTDKSLLDWPRTARRILAQDDLNTTHQSAL